MPVDQNGLSSAAATANNQSKPSFSLADLSPGAGTSPSQVLNLSENDLGIQGLRFPLDTPMYYTTIFIYDYSRKSWAEVGLLHFQKAVILPLPMVMIDNHHVDYDIQPLGWAGAAALGFAGPAAEGDWARAVQNSIPNLGSARALGARAVAAAGDAAGTVGQGIKNGILAAAGLAVNDFLTVMLKGPSYKKRDFGWRFSPKSGAESDMLQQIIEVMNDSQAPGLSPSLGSAFFSWPKVFKIEFTWLLGDRDVGKYTFRMKPSVLVDASYNYTADGVPSFFAGKSAPTGVECRMSFLELEFWLAGQFGGTFKFPSDAPKRPEEPVSPNPDPADPGTRPPVI